MKKKDIMIIVIVLAIAGGIFLANTWLRNDKGGIAIVKIDGKETGRYHLDKDQTIELLDGKNILRIKDGKADIMEADCPDGLCVKQKSISKDGESIICLPHKLIVVIESSEENDLDAVA
jgi:hypothetical protein